MSDYKCAYCGQEHSHQFVSGGARELPTGQWRCDNCPRKYDNPEPARDCCFDSAIIGQQYIFSHGPDPDSSYLKIGEQERPDAWIRAQDPIKVEDEL